MNASLPRDELSHTSGLWCWQATMLAFGIIPPEGVTGKRIRAATLKDFADNGYALTTVNIYKPREEYGPRYDVRARYTLSQILRKCTAGDYIVCTREHIMALRQGVLTDTDLAQGGRRRVTNMWRVSKIAEGGS